MRPRDTRLRVRPSGADLSAALAVVTALAQNACTHAEPIPPTLIPEPAPVRPAPPTAPPASPAPPTPTAQPAPALPPTPQPGAVVLGVDPTVGRVREREPARNEPYYRVGDYRTRVGPRWYSRATGGPVRQDDPGFQRWLRAQRTPGNGSGDLGL